MKAIDRKLQNKSEKKPKVDYKAVKCETRQNLI